MATTRVVCLGGGYAGIYLAKRLRSAVKSGKVELTIISRENFQAFHGFVFEMVSGKLQPTQTLSSVRDAIEPANLVNAEITNIDTVSKRITANRLIDGKEYFYPYDHLVVAVGSINDFSRFPGLSEHAFTLKMAWDCIKLRSHIVTMMELAEIEQEVEERKRLLTFVTAGGNYGGVEISTELNEYLLYLCKTQYKRIDPSEISTILVHSGPTLLPELNSRFPKLVDWSTKFIEKLPGMRVVLNTRVLSSTPTEVRLSSGEAIQTRTLISSSGIALNPLLEFLSVERDNEGRIITDEFCRVPSLDGVWAAGDCAAVPQVDGRTSPPLAIYAMKHGNLIARNILSTINNHSPRRFKFTGLGDAVALSRRTAVAQLKGIPIRGFVAWIIWRLFLLYYVPTIQKKIRIFLDWIIWPVVGRDTVAINVEEMIGISHAYYEAGQTIIREGDVGTKMYAIKTGLVEIYKANNNGEEVLLGELSTGDHFGEIALFENTKRTATVKAKTKVELLCIRKEEAALLNSTLKVLSNSLSNKPTLK